MATEGVVDTVNPTVMVHAICMVCNPLASAPRTALCGSKLKGVWFEPFTPIDCIVCDDIDECPLCGQGFLPL